MSTETLIPIEFSSNTISRLRHDLAKLCEVTPFAAAPRLAGEIASYGIFREVGTVNDELARFIFNADTGTCVDRASLKAQLVRWRNFTGVQITSTETTRLELRTKGFRELLHPDFSFNPDASVRQLVIFPEVLAKIAATQGVSLVLVRSWAQNSIFGGFDPAHGYYQTNFWELENNDALLFSSLVSKGQLALLGTHDLIAHVAGLRAEAWNVLRSQAHRVYEALTEYFKTTQKPSIAALVLPYTIGVVLDDLAQPPTFGSKSHSLFLDLLLEALEKNLIPADLPTFLTEFPRAFEMIIAGSRDTTLTARPQIARSLVVELVREVQTHSVLLHSSAKSLERI